jgi:hypothetical protein
VAVNGTTQVKNVSRLHEFLAFCQGLGIQDNNALPASEDILMAWASSYGDQLAERTVGAKILAIKKEHQRQGLAWQGGEQLYQILKGVEEMRPASSFYSKRALGHGRGNPQVFFPKLLPIPANTIPIRVRVWVHPQKSQVHYRIVGTPRLAWIHI